jgi:hypothetical protein
VSETTSTETEAPEAAIHPAFVIGIAVVALGSVYLGILAYWLHHPLLQYPDQSMYLATAGLLLDGKKLYVDMVDFNPPLITYLNVPAILIARAFHIPSPLAFELFLLALILVSVVVSGYLLFKDRKGVDSYCYIPFLLGYLFLSKLEVLDFGQREHLLLITYLPFFVVRYLRWRGVYIPRAIAIFAGLYAAATLSLKPHFLLMAAAPELIYVLQKRRWRELIAPETASCALLGITYGAHLILMDPEVKDRFFSFVVPLVKTGYDYYTVSFLKTISDFNRSLTYYYALTLIIALPLNRYCSLIAPTAAFTTAAFGIYIVASQDWSHHWVPVQYGVITLNWLIAAVIVRYLSSCAPQSKQLNLYMTGALCAAGLGYMTLMDLPRDTATTKYFDMSTIGYSGKSPADDVQPWAEKVLQYSKMGDYILCVSDAISPGYPIALQTQRQPASRYLHGMPLMMAKYLAWEKPRVKDKKKFEGFFNEIIEQYRLDIEKNKPSLIIVRESGIIEPLEKGGFFDVHLNKYKLVETFEEHRLYQRQ